MRRITGRQSRTSDQLRELVVVPRPFGFDVLVERHAPVPRAEITAQRRSDIKELRHEFRRGLARHRHEVAARPLAAGIIKVLAIRLLAGAVQFQAAVALRDDASQGRARVLRDVVVHQILPLAPAVDVLRRAAAAFCRAGVAAVRRCFLCLDGEEEQRERLGHAFAGAPIHATGTTRIDGVLRRNYCRTKVRRCALLCQQFRSVAPKTTRQAKAAAMQESSRIKGCKVAVIASGGNIDREVYAAVLNGETFSAK